MMPLTFDTHAFVKRLTVAGMPEPQAEAVTAMVNEAREIDLANLATKADIQAIRTDFVRLEQATKADIRGLEQSTKAEFQTVRSEIAQLAQATKAEFKNQAQASAAEFQSVRSEIAQLAEATKAEFKNQAHASAAEFRSVRSEIAQLAQSTKTEFHSLRSEMVQLEQRMTIKLGGLIVGATGLILAAFRVMH